ncbi:DNA repair helicase rad25 [Coccomyxa subellipsoidea C-169]|uniref:DNA 3'-5' helicase n=1 Tax=Coccomyxa subellipsoidea (strain C-169) TaxID=574566 RepID=I0Z664_COCSC|nr:DNA repair helicase rad25 [Coccomyxa subellipsoidea C-169]EIE26133.1 DNA repair helicase rad25 [Coccomyxa subellipsoidea C-169]|eukprot:XP_005650677.1 DNA repair helicase rad25 [Coccomyxa subellipsoidea C-169]
MVKSENVVKPEEKASLRIKLGGKDVSAVGKEGSGATKFKIKLPAAKRDVEEFVKGEESEKPAKKEKRTRKRKASSPDEVLPLWVCPDGRIFLETFSPVYRQAYDFLIAIAEPVCRPECVHEYVLTPHSLYAAVSIGLNTQTIITVLNRLSKVQLPSEISKFIQESTGNYGKVKLVLHRNKFWVESPFPDILRKLLKDEVIQKAHVVAPEGNGFTVTAGLTEQAAVDLTKEVEMVSSTGIPKTLLCSRASSPLHASISAMLAISTAEALALAENKERELHSFEIEPSQVEHVKARCLPGGLNYPMLEEYDFRNDTVNADLNIELKPHVQHRPYQEKSMAKMFGNGRARSGIIVLPCGAGKSLVGITAAARIKKSVLCLVTNSVSVDQWKHQFKLWTNLQDHQISRFTSDQKELFAGVSGVTVTTYTMVSYSGRRSEESARVMDEIASREWGLLLLDEVHVVPAQMFRKVIGIVKAHCKLGLTATLVREDERISDLNFLIGPKLYEANWLDLTRAGHIANVQCAEVWCPMTKEFYREYLKKDNAARRQLLYVMNPNKFQACQFLIQYHEQVRGDKIIVFSDNIFALREYAQRLRKPFIYGGTSHQERTRVLAAFKRSAEVSTVFLSKVGDNSIDIPEANVLIQISSHAGSRRQEAQRLGRILRAKKGKPGSQGADEFNAFFYTLVSKDTQEMYYSTKRQQFLIDQGYSFKVITNLLDAAGGASLQMSTRDEQLDVLAKVLAAGEDEAGVEVADVTDDVTRTKKALAQRTAGSLAAMSGAHGLTYMEYGTNKAQKPRLTTKSGKMRHIMFRKHAQGKN